MQAAITDDQPMIRIMRSIQPEAAPAPRAGSMRPSYSARPTMTPSIRVPAAASAQRGQILRARRRRPRRSPASSARRGQRDGLLQVQPAQHAVAADIGVDDRRHAGVLEAQRQVAARRSSRSRPSLRSRPSRRGHRCRRRCGRGSARQASRTSAGFFAAALPRITRRTPAASQASMPAMSRMPPPSCTGIVDGGEDGGDRRGVHRLAGEGAVQIDHVQPGEAGILPGARLGGGIVGIDRRLIHLAAAQPHALAVLQVDRRIERQRRSLLAVAGPPRRAPAAQSLAVEEAAHRPCRAPGRSPDARPSGS